MQTLPTPAGKLPEHFLTQMILIRLCVGGKIRADNNLLLIGYSDTPRLEFLGQITGNTNKLISNYYYKNSYDSYLILETYVVAFYDSGYLKDLEILIHFQIV